MICIAVDRQPKIRGENERTGIYHYFACKNKLAATAIELSSYLEHQIFHMGNCQSWQTCCATPRMSLGVIYYFLIRTYAQYES